MTTNVALRCGLCGGPCSDGSGVCFACEDGASDWHPDEIVDLADMPVCRQCHGVVVGTAGDACASCIAFYHLGD